LIDIPGIEKLFFQNIYFYKTVKVKKIPSAK